LGRVGDVSLIGEQRPSRRRWLCAIAALFAACIAAQSRAADFSDYVSVIDPTDGASRLNSVMLFGGRMSTTNLASTLLFNRVSVFGLSPYQPYYDNYIVGGAYQRDVYRFGGFVIAAEIGLADRFGHYTECCAPIEQTIYSSSTVNSGELWFGPAFRYEAIVFFNTVRFVPGITAGFSVVTNSIGAEEGQRNVLGLSRLRSRFLAGQRARMGAGDWRASPLRSRRPPRQVARGLQRQHRWPAL
jgi:hypothetical protein